MTRKRWVYIGGEAVEVGDDWMPAVNPHTSDGALWNDRSYDGLRATDGTDISSRTKHREYMRARGLCTIDDFKESNARAQRARDDYRTRGGTVTRDDIARAVHQLESKR